MIAAGLIAALFLICTVVMFLGVRERDGECGVTGALDAFNHLTILCGIVSAAMCY